MQFLLPLTSSSLDVDAKDGFTSKSNPSTSLIVSPQANVNSVQGVDDVFYGWVNKKARFTEQKRFIILRVHDMTLSFYADNNLWTPRSVINANLVQVVRGWQKPIKPAVSSPFVKNDISKWVDRMLITP